MPGTRPFFEALWAIMRLQILPQNLGGSGNQRIEWTFDDAVFMESAYVTVISSTIDSANDLSNFAEAKNS